MLRGGPTDDEESESGGVDDDVSTELAFELEGGDSEDAGGRDEESVAVNELLKEAAEGLREGEEKGDKRKPRMGRDSTGLDREASCSCAAAEQVLSSLPRFVVCEVTFCS
jgi:hypothetical protein